MNTNSITQRISTRQRGFIQGAIIFALALIAVIITVLSSGSSDNADQLSREQAKQQAGQIISAGTKIYTGYLRAQSDGLNPFMQSGANLIVTAKASNANAPSWDLSKYSVFPRIDEIAFNTNSAQAFQITRAGEAQIDNSGLGSIDSDCASTSKCSLLLTLDNLRKSVCDALNLKLNKKAGKTLDAMSNITSETVPGKVVFLLGQVDPNSGVDAGSLEGCYNSNSSVGEKTYRYFKVLHVNWSL